VLKPVIPDVGPPFQLVHEDDVAAAFVLGALGRGSPGPYNLAGNGQLTFKDVADALGYYAFPLPDAALKATAEIVTRTPGLPPEVRWIESVRKPVLMRTKRAKDDLGWKPKYTGKATLKAMIDAYREDHAPGVGRA
jgi:UDP-glucose 4-epimerase